MSSQELTDPDLAAFAESVELTLVEAYKAASATGKLSGAIAEAATTFSSHHQAHARTFASASLGKAKGRVNPGLLAAVTPRITAAKDQDALVGVVIDLENMAAATHLAALGSLQSPAAAQLAAAILPVEAQHAVVLASAVGTSTKDLFASGSMDSDKQRVDPAKYPLS